MNLSQLAKTLSPSERADLARRSGIAPRYLDQLLTGVRNSPSLRVLTRLAQADERLSVQQMASEFAQRPENRG